MKIKFFLKLVPVFGLAAAMAGVSVHGEVKVFPLFSDHAVLQQDKPVPVWCWVNAGEKVTARLEKNAVVVSAEGVANPVAVRYCWRNNPEATLYNGDDLPAAPFRSDAW